MNVAQDNLGWEALRATPRALDRSRYRDIPGSMPAKQPCRTGLSPREAAAALRERGLPEEEAGALVRAAVEGHAEQVVASWTQWVARHGFLDEMAALSPEERGELERREAWGDLLHDVARLTLDPLGAASSPELRARLSARATRLNQGTPNHPAVFVLERLHGLPAALAEAAVLRARVPPVWSLIVLGVFAALCALLVLGGLAAIILDGTWGALPVLVASLVFGGGAVLALAFLWRQRGRRERAWRERLGVRGSDPDT